MTADRPPEQVIREALAAFSAQPEKHELRHAALAALAVLLAEREERERHWAGEWHEEWMKDGVERLHAAEARAVAAEAERDEWRAKFEHSDNRTHANGPTAIERALRAEAELVTLRAAGYDFLKVHDHARGTEEGKFTEPYFNALETLRRAVLAGGQRAGGDAGGET